MKKMDFYGIEGHLNTVSNLIKSQRIRSNPFDRSNKDKHHSHKIEILWQIPAIIVVVTLVFLVINLNM